MVFSISLIWTAVSLVLLSPPGNTRTAMTLLSLVHSRSNVSPASGIKKVRNACGNCYYDHAFGGRRQRNEISDSYSYTKLRTMSASFYQTSIKKSTAISHKKLKAKKCFPEVETNMKKLSMLL